MAYLADFVIETASNPGTSTNVSLLGAAAGLPCMTFAAAHFVTGDKVYYTITDGSTMSESGVGTFTAGTPNIISRDTVKSNTSGTTSRLNFTGTVFVWCYTPASLSVFLDEASKCSLPGALSVTGLADFSVGGAKIAAAPSASTTAPLRADQAWQVVSKTAISASSGTTVLMPTAFSRFRLSLQSITVSTTSATLCMRFSSNGGVSFFNTNNYFYAAMFQNSSGTTQGSGGTPPQINLSHDLRAQALSIFDASVDIYPGTGGTRALVHGRGFGDRETGPVWCVSTFAAVWGNAGLMNAFQLFASTGTFAGTALLEGMP